jgi:hypothetical protein
MPHERAILIRWGADPDKTRAMLIERLHNAVKTTLKHR